MLFLCRRVSSASWWGKQCAERQPFRETADHRWANLGESEENVKGRPPVPVFPPTPEHQHQRWPFILFVCTCLPQLGCKPHNSQGFTITTTIFFSSASSSVPRIAPGTEQALSEYLLNA